MFAVAVLRPTKPRSHLLLVVLQVGERRTPVQFGNRTAEVLFDTFAYALLVVVKHEPYIIKSATASVLPVLGYREYLVVAFHRQQEFLAQVAFHLTEQIVKILLVPVQEHNIVSIAKIILDPQYLFDPMVEISQIQVCKILRQVVPDWYAVRAVNDFVQQPKQSLVLDFPADDLFQAFVVDIRVELLDVEFQAVPCSLLVFESIIDALHTTVYSSTLYATECVSRKGGNPYRLQHIHYGVMNNAVGIIRQAIYLPFLWLEDSEHLIRGGLVGLGKQSLVQRLNIRLTIAVVNANTIGFEFPPTSLFVSLSEVLNTDYLVV